MTHDEARKLLDAYFNARADREILGYVACASKYAMAEKACTDAMTIHAETTIAEQQREIERLEAAYAELEAELESALSKVSE